MRLHLIVIFLFVWNSNCSDLPVLQILQAFRLNEDMSSTLHPTITTQPIIPQLTTSQPITSLITTIEPIHHTSTTLLNSIKPIVTIETEEEKALKFIMLVEKYRPAWKILKELGQELIGGSLGSLIFVACYKVISWCKKRQNRNIRSNIMEMADV